MKLWNQKRKKKELLKEYIKLASAKRRYCYGSHQPSFRQGPHPSLLGHGDQSYQDQGLVLRDGKRKFYSSGGRGKLESQAPCDTSIHHKFETKNRTSFKFKSLQKKSPIYKNTFQGYRGNVSFNRKDFVENPCKPKAPIRAKLNQVLEELVSKEVKEMLGKGAIREATHCKDQFISHLFLVSKED